MSDRIVLDGMLFQGHHGVTDEEQATAQPIEVDVVLSRDLQPAGLSDDLAKTIDYARVYETCRAIVEGQRFRLLEAIAETIAGELIASHPVDELTIRVRKPAVRLGGPLGSAGVQITRRRAQGWSPQP